MADVAMPDAFADEARYSYIGIPEPIPGVQPVPDGADHDRFVLDQLWQKYYPGRNPGQVMWDGVTNIAEAYRIFESDQNQPPDANQIATKTKELYQEAAGILQEMDRTGLRDRDQMAEYMIRVVFAKIEAYKSFFESIVKLHNAENMQPADFGEANRGLWRFVPQGATDDLNPGQKMKMFAINDLSKLGFRRYRENIVKPVRVMTPSGFKNSCAWETVLSIPDYVKSLSARRLLNLEMWKDLTAPQGAGGIKQLIEFLQEYDDPEVPEISTDRTVFSFDNGVYDCENETFIEYENAHLYFRPNQYPIASKHHHVVIDPAWNRLADPFDIPTVTLEECYHTQEWSPEVRRWSYAFFGRLLYPVGKHDDWQAIPFLKGLAGTGKSMILNFIREIYEDCDVGMISNTIEKQFGISPLAERYLIIADDIRQDIQMDQSDFQNTISGNGVNVARKYKDPKMKNPWTATQIWSSNETPGFHDNSGSVGRRMITLLFGKKVDKPDGDMKYRLREEMGAFIIKCNRIYRNMVRRYGKDGIWTVIPKEFLEQRAELTATTNALIGLLGSEAVRTQGDQLYMPMNELLKAVNVYAKSHNLELPKWGPDYWRGPLEQKNLIVSAVIERRAYPRNTRRIVRDRFISGIDLEATCELGEANGTEVFADAAVAAPSRKRARTDEPGSAASAQPQ